MMEPCDETKGDGTTDDKGDLGSVGDLWEALAECG